MQELRSGGGGKKSVRVVRCAMLLLPLLWLWCGGGCGGGGFWLVFQQRRSENKNVASQTQRAPTHALLPGCSPLTLASPAPQLRPTPAGLHPPSQTRALAGSLSRHTCSTGLARAVCPAAIAGRLSTFSDSGPSLPNHHHRECLTLVALRLVPLSHG